MNKWVIIGLIGLLLVVVASFVLNPEQKPEEINPEMPVIIEQDLSAFRSVMEPIPLVFPQDHAAHPEFLSEWWYYTGNLFTPEGRHFSYQLTFFRRAIGDPIKIERESNWAADQIYFAHFAVTDVEEGEHHAWEVYSRGAAGLAGVSVQPLLDVWLNNWQVKQIGDNQYTLFADREGVSLTLTLLDQKGIVLHGDQGMSQKGPQSGNASMYFSQTRLITEGFLKIDNQTYPLSGISWMDHEFGTSALGKEQIGWDWFSIHMDNQSELMIFQIRENDGGTSPESSGSWIGPDSEVNLIRRQDFNLTPTSYWKNPDGVSYPIGWEISLPEQDIVLNISAVLPNQENRFSFFQYWEGAVRVDGMIKGEPVTGWGFLEMTGYGQDMSGLF